MNLKFYTFLSFKKLAFVSFYFFVFIFQNFIYNLQKILYNVEKGEEYSSR